MAQVYAIHCFRTLWAYVGCTKSGERGLKKRLREHRCLLRGGKHSEKILQSDWDRYGEAAFAVVALQELSDAATLEEKRAAELEWMERYRAQGRLYNTNLTSFAPGPDNLAKRVEAARIANTGRIQNPDERQKRRLSNIGKHTGHGGKISATKKALGQQPTRECIEKSVRNRQLRSAKKRSKLEDRG